MGTRYLELELREGARRSVEGLWRSGESEAATPAEVWVILAPRRVAVQVKPNPHLPANQSLSLSLRSHSDRTGPDRSYKTTQILDGKIES